MTQDRPPSPGMSYARARLYLGASAVGTVTVLSAFALLLDAPGRIPALTVSWLADVGWIALLLSVQAVVLFPFDLFGGWMLPREYGRSGEGLRSFVLRWFVAAALFAAVLGLAGVVLLAAARWGGAPGAVLAFGLMSLAQLMLQPSLATVIGGERLRWARGGEAAADLGPRTRVLESRHAHVTGGAYGLPGRTAWVFASRWLPERRFVDQAALLRRRHWITASGARDRGVLLALGWNLVALLLVIALYGAPDSVAGLYRLALVSTLWSFIGVLLLPTPSRLAVFQADAAALGGGADAAALAADISTLDRDQDDEPERSAGVEAIFHPIPAPVHREAALRAERGPALASWGAWHAARTALYLSWSGLGLLGRAVHCNVGRPEAWVFLPSD